MGTEPLAFRNACGRAQVPFDQKLPVLHRESCSPWATCRTRRRFIEESQAGQGIADCAGHVKEISNSCAASKQGLAGSDHHEQRAAEKPSAARNRGISSDQPYVVRATRGHYPSIQLMNMAAGAGTGYGQGDEQM